MLIFLTPKSLAMSCTCMAWGAEVNAAAAVLLLTPPPLLRLLLVVRESAALPSGRTNTHFSLESIRVLLSVSFH